MEKYAVYRVFVHTETGEVKRIPSQAESELEKVASNEWVEVDFDPEDNV